MVKYVESELKEKTIVFSFIDEKESAISIEVALDDAYRIASSIAYLLNRDISK